MTAQTTDLQLTEPDVFISYAKEDYQQVRKFYDRLSSDGVAAWLDTHNLRPGHDWDSVITSVIQRAKFVVICLSRNATLKTGYLQKEIRVALEVAQRMPEGRVFVLPIRLEDCPTPAALQRWQWVDLYKRGGYNKILAAVRPMAPQLVKQPMIRQAKPEIQELRARLREPADMLLFDRMIERRRLVTAKLSRRSIVVSDAAYAEIRNEPRPLIVEIAKTLVQEQVVAPIVFKRYFSDPDVYKHPKFKVHTATFLPGPFGGDVLLLSQSGETLSRIAGYYWNLQAVRSLGANIYAGGPMRAAVFEVNDKPVAFVMPLSN